MTLDDIQERLDDSADLSESERNELWQAIQELGEPMRASMIAAFIKRYPES